MANPKPLRLIHRRRSPMRHPFLLTLLASIGCGVREEGDACMAVEDTATTCPAPEDVDPDEVSSPFDCDNIVLEITSTETPEPSTGVFQVAEAKGCCYDAILVDRSPGSECMVGRPMQQNGQALRPELVRTPDRIAQARMEIAALEMASVGAFARLTLELLAHGAPAELLDAVARAGRDELRHAASWQKLARTKASLGKMPVPSSVVAVRPLVELAVDAAREGCMGETASAMLVRAAAEAAEDPAVRRRLSRIAADEERHAALSYRIVAWAIRTGGAEVRDAVAAAMARPLAMGPMVSEDGLEGEGLLGPTATAAVFQTASREVVGPASRALLAA